MVKSESATTERKDVDHPSIPRVAVVCLGVVLIQKSRCGPGKVHVNKHPPWTDGWWMTATLPGPH